MEDRGAGPRSPAQGDEAGAGLRRGLVALATAAVIGVYAAGYVRTEAAAERLGGNGGRRAPMPPPVPVTAAAAGPDGSTFSAATEESPTSVEPAGDPAARSAAGPSVAPTPATAEASAAAGAPTEPVGLADAAGAGPAAAIPSSGAARYRDGVFTGKGNSPHGWIEATVEVKSGRIESAKISTCWMRWPCARIAFLVPQPVERQSPEVDVITRVTDSSDAFYYALVDALSKAR